MSIGFWMYSNRQIFENVVIPIRNQRDVQQHGHELGETLLRLSPGTPFLVVLLIQIIIQTDTLAAWFCCKKIQRTLKIKRVNQEDVEAFKSKAPFFSVINKSDKVKLMQEEYFLSKNFGINRIDPQKIKEMMSTKHQQQLISKAKKLKITPNYQEQESDSDDSMLG